MNELFNLTYYVKTFGCQMNLHESERVRGLLDSCGANEVLNPDEADIVVFMTCCVREKADTHLYGQVSAMVSAPLPPSGLRTVCIGGCIAQRDKDTLKNHVSNVDVIFGTQALDKLPELIEESREGEGEVLALNTDENYDGFSTDLPSKRESKARAWVPIMYGCNNFCSYCIVPYVRGRERSRLMESIVEEVKTLVDDGVLEVTLLGQNVNSYGRDIYGSPRFAELLYKITGTGVKRIRFTSSHPKDLNDDIIDAMANIDSVMPHLHLAVQSGSTKILKAMNRKYSREDYLNLCKKIRDKIPNIFLTTDIIVGFPGESEEDFNDTMSLVKEAHLSSAYTFIYSKRAGTPAADMENGSSEEEIHSRFDRLAKLIQDVSFEANQVEIGRIQQVLVEGTSKKDSRIMVGHNPHNITTHFILPEDKEPNDFIDKLVTVKIDTAKTWYLSGTLIGG